VAEPSERAASELAASERAVESGPAQGADAVLPVTVGTVAWAVALVVLLLLRDRLRAAGDGWWIWVCVTGLALGVLGSAWVRRRRATHRRSAP
jgi:hypothetical protein